jgi:hypothetical protein
MKRVKALDKTDGTLVGFLEAASVTEETRRAYEYECRFDACSCKMHWRRAVHGKGNTEPLPPTFVKNPSSAHRSGCPGDIESIHRENVEYTTIKNGQIHIRVNFPLGSARVDRYPQRGYLTDAQLKAARDQREVQPFGSLGALAKFLEKNFGDLETEAAADVVVHYQGREVEWGKLFKGSNLYDRLYLRSQNHKHSDQGKDTPPIVTVVRPISELEPTDKGNRRFECEEQKVKIDGRKCRVVPVIVCDHHNKLVAVAVEEHMEKGAEMLVSARPFHPGLMSKPAQFGELRVSMFIHTPEQIALTAPKYWHPAQPPSAQMDLFAASKEQPSPRA